MAIIHVNVSPQLFAEAIISDRSLSGTPCSIGEHDAAEIVTLPVLEALFCALPL